MATTRPDRLADRAHDVLFRFAQVLWLPLIEHVGSNIYQWALARSKRPKRRIIRVTEPR